LTGARKAGRKEGRIGKEGSVEGSGRKEGRKERRKDLVVQQRHNLLKRLFFLEKLIGVG
jgi:hypothetical protein